MGTLIKLGLGFKVEGFMFFAFLDQPITLFFFSKNMKLTWSSWCSLWLCINVCGQKDSGSKVHYILAL